MTVVALRLQDIDWNIIAWNYQFLFNKHLQSSFWKSSERVNSLRPFYSLSSATNALNRYIYEGVKEGGRRKTGVSSSFFVFLSNSPRPIDKIRINKWMMANTWLIPPALLPACFFPVSYAFDPMIDSDSSRILIFNPFPKIMIFHPSLCLRKKIRWSPLFNSRSKESVEWNVRRDLAQRISREKERVRKISCSIIRLLWSWFKRRKKIQSLHIHKRSSCSIKLFAIIIDKEWVDKEKRRRKMK